MNCGVVIGSCQTTTFIFRRIQSVNIQHTGHWASVCVRPNSIMSARTVIDTRRRSCVQRPCITYRVTYYFCFLGFLHVGRCCGGKPDDNHGRARDTRHGTLLANRNGKTIRVTQLRATATHNVLMFFRRGHARGLRQHSRNDYD